MRGGSGARGRRGGRRRGAGLLGSAGREPGEAGAAPLRSVRAAEEGSLGSRHLPGLSPRLAAAELRALTAPPGAAAALFDSS